MRLLGMLFTICCLYFMGCLQTVHPLFGKDDLVFEENLIGSWQNEDEVWTFARVGTDAVKNGYGKAYALTVMEKGRVVAQCQARLGYVGDYAFLDVMDAHPKEMSLPLHMVYRIEIAQETLKLWFLDGKWFEDLSQNEKTVLRVEEFEQGDVAMASTEVLQTFLKDYYRDGDLADAQMFMRKE